MKAKEPLPAALKAVEEPSSHRLNLNNTKMLQLTIKRSVLISLKLFL